MTILLSDDELVALCGGLTQSAAQVRHLRAQGFWLAHRGPMGNTILYRAHYEAVCAGASPPRPVEYADPVAEQPRPQLKSFQSAA